MDIQLTHKQCMDTNPLHNQKSSCLSKKESTGFEEAQVPEQIFDLNVELMWPALSAPQFLFSHTELTH